ncbi:basic-leucine zipper transcription factor family protein [Striga asiatica]|uniref:Basic-leucine zipper transcription factor family protein n=1 Tax=Striga asiatica TaxID=4170 RepID=A0A5A7PH42_STRAF|nr:basic-leucine zipper transcription factor family protein [Striga asiatica]
MAFSRGSDEQVMDQRKRKRMQSNRESARRSRMKKQKHLDDLTAEVARLAKLNAQIVAAIGAAKHRLVAVGAENSVLRAQVVELGRRLESLNQILDYVTTAAGGGCVFEAEESPHLGFGDGFWSGAWPIVPSADAFDHC